MAAPRIPLNFFGMPFELAGLGVTWVTMAGLRPGAAQRAGLIEQQVLELERAAAGDVDSQGHGRPRYQGCW